MKNEFVIVYGCLFHDATRYPRATHAFLWSPFNIIYLDVFSVIIACRAHEA